MMNLPERCETGLMPLGDSRGSFCVWTKEKPRECGDKILNRNVTTFFLRITPAYMQGIHLQFISPVFQLQIP